MTVPETAAPSRTKRPKGLTADDIRKMQRAAIIKGRVEEFDPGCAGLSIRVGRRRATWLIHFKPRGGKGVSRHPIGYWREDGTGMSPDKARATARALLNRIHEERYDPRLERRAHLAAVDEHHANTFGAVAEKFIQQYAKAKTKGWLDTEQTIQRELYPEWQRRPIADITRRDVNDVLAKVAQPRKAKDANNRKRQLGGPYAANRCLAVMRRLFRWAVEQGYVTTSPAAGIGAPGQEQERDRVLTDGELAALWPAFDSLGYPFGQAFKLMLVTAQRRTEVGQLRWSHVDFEKKTWILPREMTKAGRAHVVPLSDLAIAIIRSVDKVEGRDLLFARGAAAERGVSGFSNAKERADKLLLDAGHGVEDWRLHDLRRTAATKMAELGVPPHVLARILNHSPGATLGITAIYNRHEYLPERRAALDQWAAHLLAIVTPKPAAEAA